MRKRPERQETISTEEMFLHLSLGVHPHGIPDLPEEKDVGRENYQIFEKLRKQLKRVRRTHIDNPDTYKKYEALRQLYVTLVEMTKDPKTKKLINLPAKDLLTKIDNWQANNTAIIDKHRGFTFFGWLKETSTRKLFNEFKRNLIKITAQQKASQKKA